MDLAQYYKSRNQMKNLCPPALALPVAAILALTTLLSNAQLADSGTPGDRAVYTIGNGATIATGLGTTVEHNFAATAVEDTADSFDLQNGAVGLTAGHHLVIYGTRYINGQGGARAGLDNTLLLNGTAIPYGAASTYSRDGSNNNHFVRGGAIVEAAQGDTIGFQSQRTDNHPQTLIQQDADLQLIKLDDSLNFLDRKSVV